MSLRINQNVVALSTYGHVNNTAGRLEKSIEKLSSGMRINRASDDAAGLAISEKMRRQIRGLNRAVLNAQDGISMVQTAEGAMNESHSILHRMRELAIQSSNDTLTSNDRLEIQKEVIQLRDDLDRIARNTEFNTKKLLDGSQTALISASSASVNGIVTGNPSQAGGDYTVSLALLHAGISEMQRSQIFTLNDGSGNLADGNTQLQSIAQFYNSNGVFVLDTPITLTLNGNAKSTGITLDAQMTLDNLSAAFQNAINSESGLAIKNSRTATVNTAQTQIAGLGGYIELVSGSIGEPGSLSVCGDQAVIDALGFTVTRQAENNRTEVTLRDSFGNVRTVRTETDRAFGLLEGIDVQFNSQAAQVAGTQGLEQGLRFTTDSTFVISAANIEVTVELNAGLWGMEAIARQVNAEIAAAGVDGLSSSIVEGQLRLSYERPISASSTIPNTVAVANFTGQADRLGLLAGTYSGFVDGNKDANSLEWGFSQFKATAAGGATVGFIVGDGAHVATVRVTLVNTVTAADMISFVDFQAGAKTEFATQSVFARVDQVGGALAFTSTLVGKLHRDNAPAYTSMVTFQFSAADTADVAHMSSKLGLFNASIKGTGDTNFRMHVVNNQPQFQIGADQGQSMEVGMADMTARALGVDKLDMTTVAGAQKALGKLNKAIDMVSSERSKLGAFQNRLEYAVNNLRSTHSNLSAAESRIRDADIAQEMIEFTRNQIVSQSGTAMLAQANMIPQGVLQLLG